MKSVNPGAPTRTGLVLSPIYSHKPLGHASRVCAEVLLLRAFNQTNAMTGMTFNKSSLSQKNTVEPLLLFTLDDLTKSYSPLKHTEPNNIHVLVKMSDNFTQIVFTLELF